MFTASPQVGKQNDPGSASHFSQWFSRTITKLMKKENFVRNLRLLTTDTETALDAIVKRNGGEKTGIFDPFDDIYHIVYREFHSSPATVPLYVLWNVPQHITPSPVPGH